MSDINYGFYTESYDDGCTIETLMTGDGNTEFTDITFGADFVAIGMGYGMGIGVGEKRDYPESTLATEIGVKWQVKFESTASIDSMIDTLYRCRAKLEYIKEGGE